MAAVGSPTGAFVAPGVARDFEDVAGADVHDVDIVIAGRTAPGKGQKLSVGSPCRIHDVALVAQIEFLGVSAVGIHHVELRNAATVADEDDGLHGFGIPGGRRDRKSTRPNSSHQIISYAVFCLKKKKK